MSILSDLCTIRSVSSVHSSALTSLSKSVLAVETTQLHVQLNTLRTRMEQLGNMKNPSPEWVRLASRAKEVERRLEELETRDLEQEMTKREKESKGERRVRLGKSTPFEIQIGDQEGEEEEEGELLEYESQDESIGGLVKDRENVEIAEGFTIPSEIYDRLFVYQRTGVRWLWELHLQQVGGIIGDEMGLGKTIQLVAFLAALHFSGKYETSLIVCPGSVLKHWANEFRQWYSDLEPITFHNFGDSNISVLEVLSAALKQRNAVIITTYDNVRIYQNYLCKKKWGYVILDEGHKIRNPDAAITIAVKRFLTPHRIIMSGAPIQNNLKELWSLFDFVFPGKLGTLPLFEEEFCYPITRGGYKNSSALQVHVALKCSQLLKSIISPYLLRRIKEDVKLQMPTQSEQILFCKLSPFQRKMYSSYLDSDEVRLAISSKDFLSQQKQTNLTAFKVIDSLRKICNHPKLFSLDDDFDHLSTKFCGKLAVLELVLGKWKEEGHRVLLFSQTRQMLNIIEAFVRQQNFAYLRLDGTTKIGSRQGMIDEFNSNESIFLFLLTTKAGGLGINLTGADRVILYDPDWNPSTDLQAKERAYRIGQKRDVEVYRLVSKGTIEEKIYHRQIFKQLLTNSIMKDPRQKRLFSSAQLLDLFTLEDDMEDPIESESEESKLSGNDESDLENVPKPKRKKTSTISIARIRSNEKSTKQTNLFSFFSHDKIMEQGTHAPLHGTIDGRAVDQMMNEKLRVMTASREKMSSLPINVPTWTGKSGRAGEDGNSLHSGFSTLAGTLKGIEPPNSSDLLSIIQKRNADEAELFKPKVPLLTPSRPVQLSSLASLLRSFLERHPYGVESDQIISAFEGSVRSAADQNLFRITLRSMAKLENKKWILV